MAALAHGALWPVLSRWHTAPPTARKRLSTIMLSGAPSRSPTQERALQQAQAAMQRALAKEPRVVAKGQVVDLPPAADRRAPDSARFLSEHDSRVQKETRSRHASSHYKNALNEPSVQRDKHAARDQGAAIPEPAPRIVSGPRETTPKEATGDGARLLVPRSQARERLALRLDPELGRFTNRQAQPRVEGNSDHLDLAPGKQGEPGTGETGKAVQLQDLIPSVGALARLDGGPSNDALPNVELGEGTFLNAREFKYASFFNRLKRSVAERWDPLTEVSRRDPTGNIYGWRARITTVDVTLDVEGALRHIGVKHSSGVDFLDREAVAAFERAAPFPNPPHGLQGQDGSIQFLFNFHVDFRGGGLGSRY